MADKKNNLIWIDLEMTGLDFTKDRIIEIATIVTDPGLNILATGPDLVIKQSKELLDAMDEWNTKQHTSSGLVEKVLSSDTTEEDAEQQTLSFLEQYVEIGYSPMCGNSICQDRRFLYNYMPKLEKYFHYRHLDVSTIKILAKMWAPKVYDAYTTKESNHRALDDIIGSIDELRYYRKNFIDV